MFKSFAIATVLALGVAMPASAVTVTQTFLLGRDKGLETQGSLFQSATAFYSDYRTGAGTTAKIGRSTFGWGAKKSAAGNIEGNRIGGGEALVFTFDTAVTLTSLTLTKQVPLAQRFEIYIDNAFGAAALSGSVSGPQSTLDFSQSGLTGTTFGIVGLDKGPGKQGIRVLGFSVSADLQTAFNAQAAAVPLPASALLLCGALALGGIVLRGRKQPS